MTDIVERLRSVKFLSDPHAYDACVQDAASEIERLRSALAAEREECAKVATSTIFEQVRIPCPDGVDGCLVQHYGPRERGLSPAEIAAAIRARKG